MNTFNGEIAVPNKSNVFPGIKLYQDYHKGMIRKGQGVSLSL